MRRPAITEADLVEVWHLPGAGLALTRAVMLAVRGLQAFALLWWAGVLADAWTGRQPWWAPMCAGLLVAGWLWLADHRKALHFGRAPLALTWHPGGGRDGGGDRRAAASPPMFRDESDQALRVKVVLDTGSHLLLRLTPLPPGRGRTKPAVDDHRWVPSSQLDGPWRWRVLQAGRSASPSSEGAAVARARHAKMASLPLRHAAPPSLSTSLRRSSSQPAPASRRSA